MAQPLVPRKRDPVPPPEREVLIAHALEPAVAEVLGLPSQPDAPDPAALSAMPPPPHDLEQCAEAILGTLPKHIADVIREIAYVTNRQPLWSLVAGHVYKAYENGDVQAPLLDPSWPRRFPALGVDPSKSTYTCEECSTTFTPKRYKQRFCSQACGEVAQARLHAADAAKLAAKRAADEAERQAFREATRSASVR